MTDLWSNRTWTGPPGRSQIVSSSSTANPVLPSQQRPAPPFDGRGEPRPPQPTRPPLGQLPGPQRQSVFDGRHPADHQSAPLTTGAAAARAALPGVSTGGLPTAPITPAGPWHRNVSTFDKDLRSREYSPELNGLTRGRWSTPSASTASSPLNPWDGENASTFGSAEFWSQLFDPRTAPSPGRPHPAHPTGTGEQQRRTGEMPHEHTQRQSVYDGNRIFPEDTPSGTYPSPSGGTARPAL